MNKIFGIIKKGLHLFNKAIAYIVFGIGGPVLSLFIVFPIFLFVPNNDKAQKYSRSVISFCLRQFLYFLKITRYLKIETYNKNLLNSKKPMIICPNHPTLLDVVILISLIPNSNCIVKASLLKNPVMNLLVSKLYIPNSLDIEDTLEQARETLDKGNHLIVFPEGTRTTSFDIDRIKFYRSPAQLALRTNHDVLAVKIDVPFPNGLSKNESFFDMPRDGYIDYKVTFNEVIDIDKFQSNELSKAARSITRELKKSIFHPSNQSNKDYYERIA